MRTGRRVCLASSAQQELGLEQVLLGAEAAAHVVDQHAHLVQRQAQHLGHDAAHHEGSLGARSRRSGCRCRPIGTCRRWAPCRRASGRPTFVFAFDDQVGLRRSRARRRRAARAPAAARGCRRARARGSAARRARSASSTVNTARQLLVLDVDQAERLFGDLFGGRRRRRRCPRPNSAPWSSRMYWSHVTEAERGCGEPACSTRGTFSCVSTAFTPGSASARARVDAHDAARARRVLRSVLPCSMPGRRHVGDIARGAGHLVEQVVAPDAACRRSVARPSCQRLDRSRARVATRALRRARWRRRPR